MHRFSLALLLLGLYLAALTGCHDSLETGYEPKPLSTSENERRSFYAPAFTPEAKPSKDHAPPPDLGPGRY